MKIGNGLKIAVVTSGFWLLCLSSCGGLTIKTWYSDATNVKPECQGEKLLIRRDNQGQVQEALTILEANAYRCYSESDDKEWRDRLALMSSCCEAKQN